MRLKSLPRSLCAAAAAAGLIVAAPTAAVAGGTHGVYGGYGGVYGPYGGYGRGYYHGGRHYRYSRGGRGAGRAAAIALGVIGGAIIINEIAENNARSRADYDHYDRDRDVYRRRAFSREAYGDGYEDGYRAGLEASRGAPPERAYRDGEFEGDPFEGDDIPGAEEPLNLLDPSDDLDARLEGASYARPSAIDAYRVCTRHAEAAMRERGLFLAAPHEPETASWRGANYRLTATVLAQDPDGASWSRAMVCDADEARVFRLELI